MHCGGRSTGGKAAKTETLGPRSPKSAIDTALANPSPSAPFQGEQSWLPPICRDASQETAFGRSFFCLAVPALTRVAGIQLNERVSLPRLAKAVSVSAPDIVPIRTKRGKAVGRLYSARRFCFPRKTAQQHAELFSKYSSPGATSSAGPSAALRSIVTYPCTSPAKRSSTRALCAISPTTAPALD